MQSTTVPTLLSIIIPGLGQIIKGEVIKGIVIFVSVAISIFLSFFLIGIPILTILYIWQVSDAYKLKPVKVKKG